MLKVRTDPNPPIRRRLFQRLFQSSWVYIHLWCFVVVLNVEASNRGYVSIVSGLWCMSERAVAAAVSVGVVARQLAKMVSAPIAATNKLSPSPLNFASRWLLSQFNVKCLDATSFYPPVSTGKCVSMSSTSRNGVDRGLANFGLSLTADDFAISPVERAPDIRRSLLPLISRRE